MLANEMTASAAATAIRSGALTSEQLVQACLDRIAQTEDRIGAWTWLDPLHALEQARAADRRQRSGAALGALHGIPVGIKDIFDTADMPTENGTVLHAGRRPAEDSTVVALLRARGRGHPRQDGHRRAGGLRAGQDHQSARPAAHARRVVERFRRCGGSDDGAAGRRHPDQRLGPAAGLVLRRLWLQALAWLDIPAWRAQAIPHPGPDRCVRPLSRRRCADRRRAVPLRRQGPGRAARHAPFPHRGAQPGRGRAAADRLRQDAAVAERDRDGAAGLHRAGGALAATSCTKWSCRRCSSRPSSGTAPSWNRTWRTITRRCTPRARSG